MSFLPAILVMLDNFDALNILLSALSMRVISLKEAMSIGRIGLPDAHVRLLVFLPRPRFLRRCDQTVTREDCCFLADFSLVLCNACVVLTPIECMASKTSGDVHLSSSCVWDMMCGIVHFVKI